MTYRAFKECWRRPLEDKKNFEVDKKDMEDDKSEDRIDHLL